MSMRLALCTFGVALAVLLFFALGGTRQVKAPPVVPTACRQPGRARCNAGVLDSAGRARERRRACA